MPFLTAISSTRRDRSRTSFALLFRLENAGDADGFFEGAGAGGQPPMQEGLFEMKVRLDEAWHRGTALGIDLLVADRLDRFRDLHDAPVLDADVHQRALVVDPYPPYDDIHREASSEWPVRQMRTTSGHPTAQD